MLKAVGKYFSVGVVRDNTNFAIVSLRLKASHSSRFTNVRFGKFPLQPNSVTQYSGGSK
jgi:hypothetical protein